MSKISENCWQGKWQRGGKDVVKFGVAVTLLSVVCAGRGYEAKHDPTRPAASKRGWILTRNGPRRCISLLYAMRWQW